MNDINSGLKNIPCATKWDVWWSLFVKWRTASPTAGLLSTQPSDTCRPHLPLPPEINTNIGILQPVINLLPFITYALTRQASNINQPAMSNCLTSSHHLYTCSTYYRHPNSNPEPSRPAPCWKDHAFTLCPAQGALRHTLLPEQPMIAASVTSVQNAGQQSRCLNHCLLYLLSLPSPSTWDRLVEWAHWLLLPPTTCLLSGERNTVIHIKEAQRGGGS